jgi:hypothetical protein
MTIYLIDSLRVLKRNGGVGNINHIGLTSNQRNNFQKLAYWGLVEKHYENNKRVSGTWNITRVGELFLRGNIQIPIWITTYRNKISGKSNKSVGINYDFTSKQQRARDFIKDIKIEQLDETIQASLFSEKAF